MNEGLIALAAAICICVSAAVVGLGQSKVGVKALDAMARQPEMQGRLFTVFILASAFIEALCLIGFVVAIM